MKTEQAVFVSLLLGITLTLVTTIRFEIESIPDLVVTRYGLPSSWLHHQTGSMAGVVDVWSIQWLALVIDLVFWFIIAVGIVFVVYKYQKITAH